MPTRRCARWCRCTPRCTIKSFNVPGERTKYCVYMHTIIYRRTPFVAWHFVAISGHFPISNHTDIIYVPLTFHRNREKDGAAKRCDRSTDRGGVNCRGRVLSEFAFFTRDGYIVKYIHIYLHYGLFHPARPFLGAWFACGVTRWQYILYIRMQITTHPVVNNHDTLRSIAAHRYIVKPNYTADVYVSISVPARPIFSFTPFLSSLTNLGKSVPNMGGSLSCKDQNYWSNFIPLTSAAPAGDIISISISTDQNKGWILKNYYVYVQDFDQKDCFDEYKVQTFRIGNFRI